MIKACKSTKKFLVKNDLKNLSSINNGKKKKSVYRIC